MTALGTFLERFYSPHPPFESLEAQIVHRKFPSPRGADSIRREIGRRRTEGFASSTTEKQISIRAKFPDKVRVETTRERNGDKELNIEVVNEHFSWHRHPNGIVEKEPRTRQRSRGRDVPTEYQRHFDHSLIREIFAALTLTHAGEAIVANRACSLISATTIPTGRLWPHWLSADATEFEFAADADRPVLLAIYGKNGTDIVEMYETQSIMFDHLTDASIFSYEPTATETIQPAVPISEHLSLAAAANKASFVILQPAYIPDADGVNLEVMYQPKRPSKQSDSLVISFRGSNDFERLWISQCDAEKADSTEGLEWQDLESGGLKMQVSEPESSDGLRVLSCEVEGTNAKIYSDLSVEEMAKIASSLRRYRD